MAEGIKIEIFKLKNADELTKSLADPESRMDIISRVSSRISASQCSSTNREISSIRLSAMALCGTMAATPITMI